MVSTYKVVIQQKIHNINDLKCSICGCPEWTNIDSFLPEIKGTKLRCENCNTGLIINFEVHDNQICVYF